MSLTGKRIYQFAEFELKIGARLLSRDGRQVPLGSKAFDVLTCLVVHAGEVVTRDELLKTVWPESFVEEGNLSQHVFALRKALGDRANFIVTVPGRGYQFTPTVREVDLDSATPKPGDSGAFLMQRTRERTHVVIDEAGSVAGGAPGLPVGAWAYEESAAGTDQRDVRLGMVRSSVQFAVTENAQPRDEELRPLVLPPFGRRSSVWLRAAAAGLAVVAAAGAFYLWRTSHSPTPPVTIVLAELENSTGDPGFDLVLKKALEIDLSQSPYIDVMSEPEALGTLRLMGRTPGTALVPEVAREVCERSNRQVLIDGSVSSLGNRFLLTLEASDCSSGKRIAQARSEAANKEATLPAMDAAADKLRHGLGESAQSLARFQVPIAQATTSSLEALNQYSMGEYLLGRMGKEQGEVLPYFERSIELDPRFAMAYAAIATGYYDLGEYQAAAPFYQNAFELSGQVSEKERLYIRAHYYADNLRDAEQGINEYRMWAEVYPRDWGPWVDMAKERMELGQYREAIEAGEKAMSLDSSRGVVYSTLARAYLGANRYRDAEATVEKAFSAGKDTNLLHTVRLETAFAEDHPAALAREAAWSRGRRGEWDFLRLQGLAAASEGRLAHAEELFDQACEAAEREHLTEKADAILIDRAEVEEEVGNIDAARATFGRMSGRKVEHEDLAYVEAELGEAAQAEHVLAVSGGAAERGTLVTSVDTPRVRAKIALARGDALGALGALAPVGEYELAGGFGVLSERGEAYLKALQPELSAVQYRKILDHRGVDPTSPLYPLALLGVARAEAQAGHLPESEAGYATLLAYWKDADQDLPVLLTARREYAALLSGRP